MNLRRGDSGHINKHEFKKSNIIWIFDLGYPVFYWMVSFCSCSKLYAYSYACNWNIDYLHILKINNKREKHIWRWNHLVCD